MFRFKQFTVADERSTQKVCTDSVLLGSWAPLPNAGRILDVGTGCGILALQAAQRTACQVVGIDIHVPSVQQARENFRNSPWAGRLEAMCISLQEYNPDLVFDAIISNPPYFSNSLKSPHVLRNTARHDEELPLNDFFYHSARLLNPRGTLSLCLPMADHDRALMLAATHGFFLRSVLHVKGREKSDPYLVLFAFGTAAVTPVSDELNIRDRDGKYTEAYRLLTQGFYLDF